MDDLMAQLKGPRRHAEMVLLAAEAPKPLPGARTPRNGGRQVEAARDAGSRGPIKPSRC